MSPSVARALASSSSSSSSRVRLMTIMLRGGGEKRRNFSSSVATQSEKIKIVECPRDAMQGLPDFVETEDKVRYINQLLRVGYDTVDFGSFVSAPAVPQMRDTEDVLGMLDLSSTSSELLAIVCNPRGAKDGSKFERIKYLGFPLSVSETFQQKNTRRDIPAAFDTLRTISDVCKDSGQELVTYISMGFGNPFGDPYSEEIVADFVEQVADLDCSIISLSDTVGCSNPELIARLFERLIPAYPDIEFGAHFHSTSDTANEKIRAALDAGCRRFDGAIGGMGGCPFAASALVGNVPTEAIISEVRRAGFSLGEGFDDGAFIDAQAIKHELFGVAVSELILSCYLKDDDAFRDLCKTHFDAADSDSSGYLDVAQFRSSVLQVLKEMGEDEPSPDRIERIFDETDADNDGKIAFGEYVVAARAKLEKRMSSL